ncbi:unnamed protein product [Rhizophagus irregularis]|nr:unnamed protein product [Rhizophagus irregularis]CAB4434498.1 unnamed protein product [Rhizophagus irregularis]
MIQIFIKSIWWRIIDDIIREYLSEEDFLELQEVLANAEKCLRDLSKLNSNQIKIIETAEIDYLDEDVAYIFDLIRFACKMIKKKFQKGKIQKEISMLL